MASVYDEITRLQGAKEDIEAAIEYCGVNVDDDALISTYADRIRAIPSTVLGGLDATVGNATTYIKSITQTDGLISATTGGVFGGSGTNASIGLVPKPSTTAGTTKYLREDGTWVTPPNTNTWRAIKVNGTQILASTSNTALNLKASTNVQINNRGGTVSISATDTKYVVVSTAAAGLAPVISTDDVTISSQTEEWVLTTKNAETPIWKKLPTNAFKNSTYSVMKGATASAAGAQGLVPAPAANKHTYFLRGDGTWVVPTNTNYYPTAFAWTNGTTSGPTGSLTVSGTSAVAFAAIPSASSTTSGIITTGAQTLTGIKTFSSVINANSGIRIGTTNDIGWYLVNTNRIAAGSSTARGVNVGNLLVSSAWADYTKVPTNGIYCKGSIKTDNLLSITANGGTLTLGSQNSTYTHYSTSGGNHWFNKTVEVLGNVIPYTNSAYTSGASNKRWSYVYGVYGNFSTGVSTPLVYNHSGILELRGSGNLYLRKGTSTNDTTALVLNSTQFKPFDSANNIFDLGSTTAKWKNVYVNSTVNVSNTTGGADMGLIVQGKTYKIGFIIGSGNGNRGVYDYTNARWMLYKGTNATKTFIDKNVYADAFFENSDERLKTFYKDIEVDLNKLSLLPKKYFKWKSDPNEMQIGTSAQEVLKLYPELVSENADGMLTVAYDRLSIIALKGIDKLHEKIKILESKIKQLENK